jgi:hypothetical protein
MRSLLPLTAVFCLAGVAGAAEGGGIFDKTPDAIYEPAGRVDPFTLGVPKVDEKRGAPRDPWEEISRKLADAQPEVRLQGAAEILTSAREDRFERCLAECAAQVPLLESAVAYLEAHPGKGAERLGELGGLLEGGRRLEATARRLKERRDIEKEFAGLKLRVTGIVTRGGQAAAAAVDGRVVREGDRLVPACAPDRSVTVRRITPKAVVLLYRGVEVTLEL